METTKQTVPLVVTCIVYTMGVCTMLPWNFFITADTYWQYKLRNTTLGDDWNAPDAPLTSLQMAFTPSLVIISNIICFIFGFITSGLTRRVGEKQRIIFSLALSLLSMGVVTILSIVDTDKWQVTFFAITIFTIALINVGIAVLQASLYGMIGLFPSQCITALVSGQSLAGVVSSLSQIISLAVGNEDPVTSGIIYFCIADSFIAAATGAYLYLLRTKFYKTIRLSADEAISKMSDKKSTSWKEYIFILNKIKWMGFTIGFILLVTLSVFPAVMVYVTSSHSPSTWADVYFQPTITFLLFNVMDMTGREIPRWFRWPNHKGWKLHVLSASRILFIPLILLCNGQTKTFPTLFHKDFYYIIINFLFALSNGYFGALAMVYYPKLVNEEETDIAGAIMASLMGVGMVVGSCLSPAFVKIWGPKEN